MSMHLGPRLAKPRRRGFPQAVRLVESDEEQARLPPIARHILDRAHRASCDPSDR